MKLNRLHNYASAFLIAGVFLFSAKLMAADFVVYSVYTPLDMGNPGEHPKKDFYVNMGSENGLKVGATLEVLRKVSTYDLLSEKLYRDVQFPIAHLKVIHVEGNAAVARLDHFLPDDNTPAISVQAVMVGDVVQPVSAR